MLRSLVGSEMCIRDRDLVDIANSKNDLYNIITEGLSKEFREIGIALYNFKLLDLKDKEQYIKKLESAFHEQRNSIVSNDSSDSDLVQLDSINQQLEKNALEREKLHKQKINLLVKINNK